MMGHGRADKGPAAPISTPVPDPTTLTTEMIGRRVGSLRDYTDSQIEVIRARLDGMDQATKVLHETVTRFPTDVDREIGHLKELTGLRDEHLKELMGIQFASADRAVKAALAASKETSQKSENALGDAITNLARLVGSKTDSIDKQVDDNKERINKIELAVNSINQGRRGADGAVASGRETVANVRANIAFAISAVLAILTIVSFVYAMSVNR